MRLQDGPGQEKPREKLLSRGPGALSDAEVLALLVGTGQRGADAVAIARRLLAETGGLRGLLDQPAERLARLPGIGIARACRLAAVVELGHRHLAQGLARGEALTDPGKAGDYLTRRLRALPYEVFACLFLDTRHRVIAFEELFRGTLDGAEVHPREVVQRCLAHHAAAVILGHNHPSGCTEPSAADRAVTARLRQALGLVEVRLLDHFIVGDGPACSMARLGAL